MRPTVTTDQSVYGPSATVTVTYADLPGNANDWIAIASAGADAASYVAYVYTGGQVNGTATFPVPAVGSYVARAFLDNTFTLIAQSPTFKVTTIETDAAAYPVVPATVKVSYGSLPGNAKDWVAIASAGSSLTNFTSYVYTNGQTSGTATFSVTQQGKYVARTFLNNTYTLIAESAPFQVGTLPVPATITTAPKYGIGGTITVTFSGLPGTATDWIGLYDQTAADPRRYLTYKFTNGATSGTLSFPVPPGVGTYVARAFTNGYTGLGSSAPFTVDAAKASPNASSYVVGDTITVTYSGMPANPGDAIVIAPNTAGDFVYSAIAPTNGQLNGIVTFTADTPGVFQARVLTASSFPPATGANRQRLWSSFSFTVSAAP
ncbi:MAG TPA: hypothetical protein VN903_03095 [Polyangia bacterium]|nr:hypothetical protein [Polyangia bacterium]